MRVRGGGAGAAPGWYQRVSSAFRGHGAHASAGIGAVCLSVSQFLGESVAVASILTAPPWWFIGGLVGTVGSVVAGLTIRPTYGGLERDAAELRDAARADRARADAVDVALRRSLDRRVRDLARGLVIAHQHEWRISAYHREPKSDRLRILVRWSHAPGLCSFGRRSFRVDQGAIGEAWEKGEAVVRDLPRDRADWEERLVRRGSFTAGEAAGLTMQARSLVALCLKVETRVVGMLVIEHLRPRGVQGEHLHRLRHDFAEQLALVSAEIDTVGPLLRDPHDVDRLPQSN